MTLADVSNGPDWGDGAAGRCTACKLCVCCVGDYCCGLCSDYYIREYDL